MKTIVLLTIASISPSILFSQEKEKPKKKHKITSTYVLPGGNIYKDNSVAAKEFMELNPNSTILNGLTNDFKKTSGGMNFNSTFNFNIGISKYNNEKSSYNSNTELRIGVSYSSNNIMSAHYSKEDISRVDTLSSNQTGNSIYQDSVTYKNYSMTANSDQLRFDASLIFRTNNEARWSLFVGIGFDIGSSFHSYAYIDYYEYSYNKFTSENVSGVYSSPGGYNSINNLQQREQIKMKDQIAGSVYLPMGIDFRVGSRKEFFKRLHTFIEIRPYLNNVSIPELKTNYTNVGTRMGMGLRVTI